jgi:hypothetical protein
MRLARFLSPVLVASLAIATFSGCGHAPTAPETATPAPSSNVIVDRVAQPTGLIGAVGGIVGGLVNLLVKTLNLVGSLGGSLTNGRWRVVIPPDAVSGDATVTLGVTSSTSGECQLEISPADKNHFDRPATLTIDCRNLTSDQLRSCVIKWFDPSTGKWVPVQGSAVDLTNKSVSAPLQHFSRYCVGPVDGKAGW